MSLPWWASPREGGSSRRSRIWTSRCRGQLLKDRHRPVRHAHLGGEGGCLQACQRSPRAKEERRRGPRQTQREPLRVETGRQERAYHRIPVEGCEQGLSGAHPRNVAHQPRQLSKDAKHSGIKEGSADEEGCLSEGVPRKRGFPETPARRGTGAKGAGADFTRPRRFSWQAVRQNIHDPRTITCAGICRLSQRGIPSPRSLSQARNGTLSQVRGHAGRVPSRGMLHGTLPQMRGKARLVRVQDPGRGGRKGVGRSIPVCAVPALRSV